MLQLTHVAFVLSAHFFEVAALCVRLLSRNCLGFRVQATHFWHVGFGQGTIHGLHGVCLVLAPLSNLAVKRDAALVRVAPYF